MIQYLYLGRMEYAEALALQQELVELRHQGRIHNTLLLLEHPPILTLGRGGKREHLLASPEELVAPLRFSGARFEPQIPSPDPASGRVQILLLDGLNTSPPEQASMKDAALD